MAGYKRGKHGTRACPDSEAKYGDGVGKRVFKGSKATGMNPKGKTSKRY